MKTIERLGGDHGELVLRGDGEHFEIICNGVFLMDTRAGESERLLVRAALDRTARPGDVLIGGLGVGFTAAQALRHPAARTVTVIEREPAIIAWHATHLRRFSGQALRDPRLRIERADVLEWLTTTTDRYDVVCMDIDNGPDWTVSDGNAAAYGPDGLALIAERLRPGGALAVWSAGAAPAFAARLADRFIDVTALPVPVPRGEPDVVYLASTRPR